MTEIPIGDLVGGISRVLKLKAEQAEALESKLAAIFGATYDLEGWLAFPNT